MRPRILLLSAYDADSHHYWHQQLTRQFIDYDWRVLTLKSRFFSWRMAANALNFKHLYHPELSQKYDLVIATSMTDLSTLRGLYPHLGTVPNLLYFHENQFAYPENPQQQNISTIQFRSVLSALAADALVFNSDYNRRTFVAGSADLLAAMPDGVPADIVSQLEAKSQVLAVPLKNDCLPLTETPKTTENPPLEVVWNHRWEHDKGPETLLALLQLTEQLPIKFHILGQRFNQLPKAFKSILKNHPNQCLTLGYVEKRSDYIQILQSADVVVSTAYHDFQGIAMLEAVACGCWPIAPNRLVYPDLYPERHLYHSTADKPKQEAAEIVTMLLDHIPLKQPNSLSIDKRLRWAKMADKYQKLIAAWL